MKQIIQDLKKGDTILEEVPVPSLNNDVASVFSIDFSSTPILDSNKLIIASVPLFFICSNPEIVTEPANCL